MADWAFVEHVTEQLLRPRPGDSKHPTLWPSEATATYENEYGETVVDGKCRRAGFFRYLIDSYKFYPRYKIWKPLVEQLQRERSAVDKYMLWIWRAGELYEEYLISQSQRSGVYVSDQVPMYIKSHNVSGKKDIEVINPVTKKLSIVEVKSVYGFGANFTLGSPADRKRGKMGEPKAAHLMQLGIYHWWTASNDDAYEESRITYGARDTGRYAEYLLRTTTDEDGLIWIEYQPWHPYKGQWVRTKYTINNVLQNYVDRQQAVDGGRIPERDFDLQYSLERLTKMYEREQFGKTDREKYEKIKAREQWNTWIESLEDLHDKDMVDECIKHKDELPVAIERSLSKVADPDQTLAEKEWNKLIKALRKMTPKKELQPLVKGDWQCRFCNYAPICYDEAGVPRKVE